MASFPISGSSHIVQFAMCTCYHCTPEAGKRNKREQKHLLEIENNREGIVLQVLTFSYLSTHSCKLKSTALQVSAENPQHIRHRAKLWTFPGVS